MITTNKLLPLWRESLCFIAFSCFIFLFSCTTKPEITLEDTARTKKADVLAFKAVSLNSNYPNLHTKPIVSLKGQPLSPKLIDSLEDGTVVVIMSGMKVLKILPQHKMLVYTTSKPRNIFMVYNTNTSKLSAESLVYFKVAQIEKKKEYYYSLNNKKYKILVMTDMKLQKSEINTLISTVKFKESYGKSYTHFVSDNKSLK